MKQERETLATKDSEKTLVAPRFDEEAISHARPAVPIDEADGPPPRRLKQAASELTSSRLALALVLVSMLASFVIGALLTVLYQRHAASSATAAAQKSSATTPRTSEPEDFTPAVPAQTAPVEPVDNEEETPEASSQEYTDQLSDLRTTLDQWIATTNARDLNRQKDFYMPKVSAFYRARNVSRDEVLADKARTFEHADLIDVRAEGEPEITIHPNGRIATMRFRKQYAIKSGQQDHHGEVVQELRWRRTGQGWKIISERDVKVIQ
jgi:hypothetical protein